MEKTQDARNPESELKHLSSEVQGISGALIPNLMHNLPGMAYRCKNDAQWSMVFLSEGSLELTGYAASDLVGNHLLCYDDIIVEEDRDYVRRAIDTAVENRTQFQMEYRIRAKSGTIKWVWEKGNAVYDKHNTPVYLDGFIIDVSARRKAEDDLKKAAQDMIELNATKDRFFSLLAHDLQNPVYAIISLSEFIAENFGSFDKREIEDAMLQVNSAARGIYTLLENLLDWARLQSGQVVCQKEFVSLSKAVSYAIDHYAKAAAQKGINIEFDQEHDFMVESDLRLLSSILRNLLSNALKYSYPKSSVRISLSSNNGTPQISVTDYGIGISRRHLQKIFRIDNELRQYGTANESGSGLGLILVKSFAELISAEISVESKLNHGSTFSLRLLGKID